MDEILDFFISTVIKLWSVISDFTVPFGSVQVSFVLVIASIILFNFFAKIFSRFFDTYYGIEEAELKRYNLKNMKEQKRRQKELLDREKERQKFEEEQLGRHRYRLTVSKEGRK